MISETCSPQVGFQSFYDFSNFFSVTSCKFNDKNSSGITLDKKAIFALLNIIFGTLKNIMIDQFAGTWLMP